MNMSVIDHTDKKNKNLLGFVIFGDQFTSIGVFFNRFSILTAFFSELFLFEQELMIQIDKINADNLKMFFFRFFMIYY